VGVPVNFTSPPLLESGGKWIQYTPGKKP
jgi:hypothetical protein